MLTFVQQKGLGHLTTLLKNEGENPFPVAKELPTQPITSNLNLSSYHNPRPPPLPPHPFAHHTRSASHAGTTLFITNLALLPPPDSATYPGPNVVELEAWENRMGYEARGWMEGGELFAEEEAWAGRWAYEFAVDGKVEGNAMTAFRSRDGTSASSKRV